MASSSSSSSSFFLATSFPLAFSHRFHPSLGFLPLCHRLYLPIFPFTLATRLSLHPRRNRPLKVPAPLHKHRFVNRGSIWRERREDRGVERQEVGESVFEIQDEKIRSVSSIGTTISCRCGYLCGPSTSLVVSLIYSTDLVVSYPIPGLPAARASPSPSATPHPHARPHCSVPIVPFLLPPNSLSPPRSKKHIHYCEHRNDRGSGDNK
ncbi:hypothetical protein CC1G_15242 [Coprinopsis cinerea okayama7|uniref:Uncharacterized protein n=1 Tax=Coprinopsis cinerea (strain Okayama-7 / 130 / ATCC MYA-4618 / FGSC 9003) TaxID=240176 RepID=D6RQ67_COPC7|nr:hypothetical protein CC1G_15242 [Coprinopsis cinerea okayama7\|eukprot:XP_002910334.1 hypothetical protein CC1G_15242 [Coprinopsis cinerea okayama7\